MAPLDGGMPNFGRVYARSFAIQAAWNYERMLGTGFGWTAEPALRSLEGDTADGRSRYRDAVSRQSAFFNSHPYLAALAIGAAVRAEHEGASPEKIARLRDALCSPLGSIGDRIYWAAWLPACAAIGIVLAAAGAGIVAVGVFLVLYNAAHCYGRWWALRAGWNRGLNVAGALASPALRVALERVGPVAAFCLGV